ncbi:MAG: hypothetical protein K9W44_09885 [Candidatus Lokiarchaeota archaeon]|nr:hypothetical protein [Candidatus Harpocratesius repetitus]
MEFYVFWKLLLVYGFILVGVLLGGVVGSYKERVQKEMVNLLINLITPLQVFIIILVSQFNLSIESILQIIGIAIISHYTQFYIGLKYFSKKSDDYRRIGAQTLHGSFPNSLYYITPIILLVFPEELLIIPVIYASAMTTIKATFLPLQVHNLGIKSKNESLGQTLRKLLLFPPFLGILFGILFRALPQFQTSDFLIALKTPLSQITSAVSAILIGISLVGISKKRVKFYKNALMQTALIRFVLGMLIFLCLGFILHFPNYQTEIRTILFLIICAPPAQNNVIYSIYFEFDEQFAALGVVVLTLIGLIMLPLMLWFGLSLL